MHKIVLLAKNLGVRSQDCLPLHCRLLTPWQCTPGDSAVWRSRSDDLASFVAQNHVVVQPLLHHELTNTLNTQAEQVRGLQRTRIKLKSQKLSTFADPVRWFVHCTATADALFFSWRSTCTKGQGISCCSLMMARAWSPAWTYGLHLGIWETFRLATLAAQVAKAPGEVKNFQNKLARKQHVS